MGRFFFVSLHFFPQSGTLARKKHWSDRMQKTRLTALAFFSIMGHLQADIGQSLPPESKQLKVEQITTLQQLQEQLAGAQTEEEKLHLLKHFPTTERFLRQVPLDFSPFSEQEKLALYTLLALDQGSHLELEKASVEVLKQLANQLQVVEQFYEQNGGAIGYHLLCKRLHAEKDGHKQKGVYLPPKAVAISENSREKSKYVLSGIKHLEELAEIYPVGGAADRLSKRSAQIAATHQFCEKTLLERLIDDVQAKEYLYKKLYGKQVQIPIVMMTSEEKGGTGQIKELLEKNNWFGKDPQDFYWITQPLVPAMTPEGKWCSIAPGKLLLKPGGHGVIWKIAQAQGALAFLKERGKTKAFVRQINNPIAGVDDGILAFLGYGFAEQKDFGFAGCPRKSGASEGVDVVIQTDEGCCLTNIEYCDFERYNVDENADLLANTNLLFVDLDTVEELLEHNSVPGMLVNAKEATFAKEDGSLQTQTMMRLESTMQNLADSLVEQVSQKRSFITCNERGKTISAIKREYEEGGPIEETPKQCFLDMQENSYQLLTQCRVACGKELCFEYHPALGPLYSVIAQKLRGGTLADKSLLKLEISEVEIEELSLDGALTIEAEDFLQHPQEGRCTLKGVRVQNRGVDYENTPSLASSDRIFHQQCRITIEPGGEFYAEDVTFSGNLHIVVPANTRLMARPKHGGIEWSQEPITKPSWVWDYSIGREDQLVLQRKI